MCEYVAAQAFLHREHDATAFLTPAQKKKKRLHIGKDWEAQGRHFCTPYGFLRACLSGQSDQGYAQHTTRHLCSQYGNMHWAKER